MEDFLTLYFLIRYTETKITLYTDQYDILIKIQKLKVQHKILISKLNIRSSRLVGPSVNYLSKLSTYFFDNDDNKQTYIASYCISSGLIGALHTFVAKMEI